MSMTELAKRKGTHGGFTLVELMIVVTIIGIISTIAFPSYQGFIQGSNRGAAQADLMALAAAMERHKAAAFSYRGAANGGSNTGTPAIFHGHSPSSEAPASKQYDLRIDVVSISGTSYTIRARPVSGSTQADDGDLFFFSDGRKAWDKSGNGSSSSSEFCWRC
jgi:type IV pilus assembly protein PilE